MSRTCGTDVKAPQLADLFWWLPPKEIHAPPGYIHTSCKKKEKKTRYVVKFNVNKAIFEPNNLICNENNSFLRTQSSLSQSQKDANKDKQYYLQRNTKNPRSYVSELQIFLANTAGRYKHLNNIVIQ